MNNFTQRTLSGAVFVLVVAGSVLLHPLAFMFVSLAFAALTLFEFYQLHQNHGHSPDIPAGILSGMLLFLLCMLLLPIPGKLLIENNFWGSFSFYVSILAAIIILLLAIPSICLVRALYLKKPHPYTDFGITLTGIIYIITPFLLMNFFYYPDLSLSGKADPVLLISFFLLIWTNDTFAYLTGMWIGRHHLFPRISPKKTWEGSAGGALMALILSWLLSTQYHFLTGLQWLLLGLVTIVSGTFGDLAESMLKRSYGLKDSGNVIPGHGGFLDRFDATLMAAPIVFVYLIILNLT